MPVKKLLDQFDVARTSSERMFERMKWSTAVRKDKVIMKVGNRIELTLEKLALGGEAIGRTPDGIVVFVKGGVPGDRAIVEIVKRKRQFIAGKIVELLEPSDLRIRPRCEYFGQCGGCKWQFLSYEKQLHFKQQLVAETLEHIGKLQDIQVNDILGMEEPWYYRNKMEFSFHQDTEAHQDDGVSLLLGQHVAGHWNLVVDLQNCYLQSERSVDIFYLCREFAKKQQLSVFSSITEQGLLRHVVVREGKYTGDLMVNMVTSGEYFPQMDRFVRYLTVGRPDITSIMLTINRRKGQSSQGQEEHLIFGNSTIKDTLNGITFDYSAQSFFQTNTRQAEQLYQIVQRMAGDVRHHSGSTAVDLYCGTGAIAFHLAPHFKKVYGVELVEDAVENARRNAERNKITNVEFHCGEVQKLVPDVLPEAPDLIVVDPPRAGVAPKVLRHLIRIAPPQIVYVSCNPATLARDVEQLTQSGYKVAEVQPVDMFPHTYHIETVVNLIRE
jgi:23S rRNA (uracil1939-C5)-methyltransferase